MLPQGSSHSQALSTTTITKSPDPVDASQSSQFEECTRAFSSPGNFQRTMASSPGSKPYPQDGYGHMDTVTLANATQDARRRFCNRQKLPALAGRVVTRDAGQFSRAVALEDAPADTVEYHGHDRVVLLERTGDARVAVQHRGVVPRELLADLRR